MVSRNSQKPAEAALDASPAGVSASPNTTSSNSTGSSSGHEQSTNSTPPTQGQSDNGHTGNNAPSNKRNEALVPSGKKPTKPPPLPPPSPSSSLSSSSETPPSPRSVPTASGKGSPPPSPPSSSLSSETPPLDSAKSNRGSGGDGFLLKHSGSQIPLGAGVVGGILALVVIMIIVACLARRKRRKPADSKRYRTDPATAPKGNDNYAGGHNRRPSGGGRKPPQPLSLNGGDSSSGPYGPALPPPSPNLALGFNKPPPLALNGGETSSGPYGPVLPPPSPTLALGFNKSTFTYEELAAATDGFTEENLLGQGGFGYVHKGVLPNGKEVAVKSLKSGSGQGEREFHAEVDIISRVHHRHLVSLVGYCISGSKRLLVYDFVPNGTLEYHLHAKGLPTMDWPTRLKIAVGSAKGLAYLHEDCHPRIIHRDIKTANILIDFKFEARVADFGLAKLSSDNNTHVSTRVMGTFGYLAPEYASSGKLTEKSDVFSYGVMLLELITGRRPCDSSHSYMEDSLVDWARPVLSQALSDGKYDGLVDSNLTGNYVPAEMTRMVASAAAAVRHSARRRPKMSQIVRALEGDLAMEDLNEGMKPGQSMLFGSGSDLITLDDSTRSSPRAQC